MANNIENKLYDALVNRANLLLINHIYVNFLFFLSFYYLLMYIMFYNL